MAEHHGRLVPELARAFVGREDLEEETARVLVALARQAAQRRHADGEEPPDGEAPIERLIRARMLLLQAQDDERADRALGALMER